MKIKLSVAMATYNEERNIGACLGSVKEIADEIVIVDGNSADNTKEIAEKFKATVIVTDNKPMFHVNKQRAIDECKGEWLLLLDADEIITPGLAKEIRQVIGNTDNRSPVTDNQPVAYWINRKKMFLGRWMKKGGQYPDPVIRLFQKGKANLACKSVHEQLTVNGDTGSLNSQMLHIPTSDFSAYIQKDNRYSSLSAEELKNNKIKLGFVSFIRYFYWEPFSVFFSIYIRHRGFVDGFPGFVFAFYSGLHRFTAYVKYWESINGKQD